MANKKRKRKKQQHPSDHPDYDGSTRLRTRQQERFIKYIIQGLPQWIAYQKAGYRTENCAEMTIHANASRLANSEKVQRRLAYKRRKLDEKWDKSAEDAIRELAKLGFANVQNYLDDDNTVKDLSKIPRDDAAAIESITVVEQAGGRKGTKREKRVKFTMANKRAALAELLDRTQGKPAQRIAVAGVVGVRELSDDDMSRLLTDRVVGCDDVIAD